MESSAVGLARQGVAIACSSALLVGAIYSGMSPTPRPSAARQNFSPPIQVQSVVSTPAPPAAVVAATPLTRSLPRDSCAHSPCARASLAKTQLPPPRPAVERTAEPIVLASAAPAPERDSSLQKRLFAPVGAFRDSVVRLIRWP
jgi:hypothetical protein